MTRRILVTGAAGFLGYHVADRLLASGAEIRGLDNLNDYYDVELKRARLALLEKSPAFTFRNLDIADYDAVAAQFAAFRPEIVVHLAAQAGVRYSLDNPRAYVRANVDGHLSILEACRAHPVRHLVYASSSSVYGVNAKVPFAETDPVEHPVSLYAATKRAGELMSRTYAHLYGLASSGLRFFTVYGPWGRPDMAYFKFTKAILEGRPIDVYNNGDMCRDFTYVDDVTSAIVRLIGTPPDVGKGADPREAPHCIYNIGNHTPVSLGDFIAAIETATGRTAVRNFLPMQPGDVPVTYADVDRLAATVDFAPSTPLADGLAHFVRWYRAYYRV